MNCKSCSSKTAGGKDLKGSITDEQLENFKQMFMMFDKVTTCKSGVVFM